jgi:hypothetical protein
MDINQFFVNEASRPFNQDALIAPKEFIGWQSDDTILTSYFNWIRESSRCACLRLDINASIAEVVEELEHKASKLAVPHRAGDSVGWRTITLHGYSSLMSDYSGYYKEEGIVSQDAVETWTDACGIFPKTVQWIKDNIPFTSYSRIRIMVLDAGGHINPHRDWQGQMLGGGINIAMTNPAGVEFGLENGGLVPWVPGDVRIIDVARHHGVRNLSSTPRIHIIASPLGKTWNKEAMQLACKSYSMTHGMMYD